ncbi:MULTISPECIES: hypothetical protein [unclassified Ensifer]|uniref:glycosyltransferase family 39 protein n=1 Tax=unclassified Ensifer TaxID=2633371 RepID=UPI000813BC82|nr:MULTISPECIES: hypothetical protein [unclassified Ensifer]OCP10109.1 hypothetical protein BC362_07980 [Ensifer sp. LC14]OCP12229.1 hypothetical protein BC374_15465 [Ensifer sp. LC13]OCP13045.1 hypothetical protein BBX50_15245 [Ensifer sp. LC11]OCP33790.1 hypothetical protein BC364_14555 [Ensifer sp. LC499]
MTYPANVSSEEKVSVRGRSVEFFYYLATALFFLFVSYFLFLRIMNFEMRRDEQLYVPPIRLLNDHALYGDFFYNHPPGSAWYFYGIGKLVEPSYLLLSGRVGVFLAWILFAVVVAGVVHALTRSGWATVCVVVVSLVNELFLTQTGVSATNNFLPWPFAFLGLSLFLFALRNERRRAALAVLAGFFLALAVSFKLSAVAFIPAVAVAAFLLPRSLKLKDRIGQVAGPLMIGGLLGGAPILAYLFRDPELFIAHVVRYHTGPHPQYWRLMSGDGEGGAMSLAQKLALAQEIWFAPAVAVALAALLAVALTVFARRAENTAPEPKARIGEVLVLAGVLLCSVALSFVPTPGFPQYFAPPLVCIPLAFALLLEALGPGALPMARPILLAAALVVLAVNAPRLGQYIGKATHPQQWATMRVHEQGMTIAERMQAAGVSGKVATLSPIYPLEGGLDVYAELATGPFAYRTAAMTDPELAKYYKMASPATIEAMFDKDPPAALLLGFEEELEKPMHAYALSHGYVQSAPLGFKDRYGTPTLYLKPGSP